MLNQLWRERVIELRPFDCRIFLAVRHADFHAAAAGSPVSIRGCERHHINTPVASACPFCTEQDLVAGHRRIRTRIAIPQAIDRLILRHARERNLHIMAINI